MVWRKFLNSNCIKLSHKLACFLGNVVHEMLQTFKRRLVIWLLSKARWWHSTLGQLLNKIRCCGLQTTCWNPTKATLTEAPGRLGNWETPSVRWNQGSKGLQDAVLLRLISLCRFSCTMEFVTLGVIPSTLCPRDNVAGADTFVLEILPHSNVWIANLVRLLGTKFDDRWEKREERRKHVFCKTTIYTTMSGQRCLRWWSDE